ncbi:MAG: hypothetical protein E6230_10050 [Paenibacillus dendritiformis]|uniref:hypothetical protein n=1 Tax=Paenibacillus dendritiformis TaxID=130049 RepID=UPI001F22E1F1|nr:hypothetical protein [Paenibacillus dendritiformis]MDU5142518.1 hypothetical protein [Paenibacillus dendritiformis]
MRQLLDVPEAMVEAFDVPNSDRYQAKNSGDGVFFTYTLQARYLILLLGKREMQRKPNNKDKGNAPYHKHGQQMNHLFVAFEDGSLIIAFGFCF